MNLKNKAILKLVRNKYELHCEDGQVVERDKIGWISEHIETMYSHLPRVIKPITEDDLQIILESGGECYIELEEVRKMSHLSWEKTIDSYSNEDDAWYHELRLVDRKIILHFN